MLILSFYCFMYYDLQVIEITPDSTPSSMVTRSRSLLNKAFQQMHSMRNRPNKVGVV